MPSIKIGDRLIGDSSPVYFIADIAANHDGDLNRAKKLIRLAKDSGADAAKFQNFQAVKIVSDYGFKHLDGKQAHQSTWKKSVFEVYQDYSISQRWTLSLKEECDKVGIDYFSTPYDFESVDHLDPLVEMFKIGSGDITWLEMLSYVAKKGKPILLATGACSLKDVQMAASVILKDNPNLALLQCNTNYTANIENYRYINLNVLHTYRALYPDLVLGLSDHTVSSTTVLGAVALGAKIIEKHFTDDNAREGPDHHFAMNPRTWEQMVVQTREMEQALGDGVKRLEPNEEESAVVQQRCLRAAQELAKGQILKREHIDVLRPAPQGSINPQRLSQVLGRPLSKAVTCGDFIRESDLE